jgi:hypothetical protein
MARPKGSKTKVTPEPKEYVYDDADPMYQQVMAGELIVPGVDNMIDESVTEMPAPIFAGYTPATIPSTLFLVEGKVRLDQEGNAPVVVDQRRIVNAANVDEALQKFVNYFVGLSSSTQQYSIVQAAASETIL